MRELYSEHYVQLSGIILASFHGIMELVQSFSLQWQPHI